MLVYDLRTEDNMSECLKHTNLNMTMLQYSQKYGSIVWTVWSEPLSREPHLGLSQGMFSCMYVMAECWKAMASKNG